MAKGNFHKMQKIWHTDQRIRMNLVLAYGFCFDGNWKIMQIEFMTIFVYDVYGVGIQKPRFSGHIFRIKQTFKTNLKHRGPFIRKPKRFVADFACVAQ